MAVIFSSTILKVYIQQNGIYTSLAQVTTASTFKIVSISNDGTIIYAGLGNENFQVYLYDLNTNLIANYTSPTTLPSNVIGLDCS